MAPILVESECSYSYLSLRTYSQEADGKRKAAHDLDIPGANKRFKDSHSQSPDTDARLLKVIPFPEKVG